MAPISLDDPAVRTFIVYSALLAVKMLAMSLLTARQRFRRGAFANPEDIVVERAKVKFGDEAVERVRRAHLNDLENIPAFWALGALYLTTGPGAAAAAALCRLFAAARLAHTLVYAVRPLPQPARALCFFAGYFVQIYMAACVVLHYLSAL